MGEFKGLLDCCVWERWTEKIGMVVGEWGVWKVGYGKNAVICNDKVKDLTKGMSGYGRVKDKITRGERLMNWDDRLLIEGSSMNILKSPRVMTRVVRVNIS